MWLRHDTVPLWTWCKNLDFRYLGYPLSTSSFAGSFLRQLLALPNSTSWPQGHFMCLHIMAVIIHKSCHILMFYQWVIWCLKPLFFCLWNMMLWILKVLRWGVFCLHVTQFVDWISWSVHVGHHVDAELGALFLVCFRITRPGRLM